MAVWSMKKYFLITALLLAVLPGYCQKKQGLICDSATVAYLNKQCGKNVYKLDDDRILRHYDGYDFRLIDTSGIYVYTKVNEIISYFFKSSMLHREIIGYFSPDICGKMYDLDFHDLKKIYKPYKSFIHKAYQMSNKEYYTICEESGITYINELYYTYVKGGNKK